MDCKKLFSKIIQRKAILVPSKKNKNQMLIYGTRYSIFGLIDRICINVIYDDIDYFHSHPWDYVSIILWGGYKETIWKDGKETVKIHKIGSIIRHKHSDFHRLKVLNKRTINLFFMSKKKRTHINIVRDNKPIHEAKFWLLEGISIKTLKNIYNNYINKNK